MSNTRTREYTVVRLAKDNINDLALLHAEVYGTRSQVDYFAGKYETSYTGVGYAGFIAYNRNQLPIAYYGVIPCFLQFGNETMLAAQSADTMTHPEFRFKGMFTELSHLTFDLCKELGIRLIFGFPNQNSYHGAITKLGWKETETMDCFTIPVKSLPLQSIAQKFKLSRIYERHCKSVLDKFQIPLKGLGNSVFDDGFAGVYRDESYLKYKTYNATRVLGFNNTQIWISKKKGLLIGDMQHVNAGNFKETINALTKLSAKLGLNYLQFHGSPGTSLHQLFSGTAKVSKSFPVLFQDFGCPIPLEKIKFSFADIDIF